MRQLTLDEKITLKGIFARRGLHHILRLTMADAVLQWNILFGYLPISKYYLFGTK